MTFDSNPVDALKGLDQRIGVLERTQTQSGGGINTGVNPNQPSMYRGSGAGWPIKTSTWTEVVTWDTTYQGPVPMANGMFTPDFTGWYEVNIMGRWAGNNAGRRFMTLAAHSGTPASGNYSQLFSSSAYVMYHSGTMAYFNLTAGTTYSLFVYQDSGSTLNLDLAAISLVPLGGIRGPAGPAGSTGTTGDPGPTGGTGPPGATGPGGPQGVGGPPGSPGVQGPPGLAGSPGPPGIGIPPNGAQGTALIKRSADDYDVSWADVSGTGIPGPPGPDGPTGPPGADGPAGPQGNPGDQGPTGPTGADGIQGPPGNDGGTGPQGPPGNDGADGGPGPTGPQGMQGEPGPPINIDGTVDNVGDLPDPSTVPDAHGYITNDTGHLWVSDGQGSWLDAGPFQGPAGPPGSAGNDGAVGPQGDPGPVGPQGVPGPAGNDGTSVEIQGSVPNQAALPTDLTTDDAGKGWITDDTGHLWVWTGQQWTDAGVIVGPPGARGSLWWLQYQPYATHADVPSPQEQDIFLYQDTHEYWEFLQGTWHDIGTLGGPAGATGATGAPGPAGPPGQGIPTGGATGQSLVKIDGTDYNVQWKTVAGGYSTVALATGGVWNVIAPNSVPTNGQISCSGTTSANSTWLRFHFWDANNRQVVAILQELMPGDTISLARSTTSSDLARYVVTALPTTNTGSQYVEVAVSFVEAIGSSGGALPSWAAAVVDFSYNNGSGGSSSGSFPTVSTATDFNACLLPGLYWISSNATNGFPAYATVGKGILRVYYYTTGSINYYVQQWDQADHTASYIPSNQVWTRSGFGQVSGSIEWTPWQPVVNNSTVNTFSDFDTIFAPGTYRYASSGLVIVFAGQPGTKSGSGYNVYQMQLQQSGAMYMRAHTGVGGWGPWNLISVPAGGPVGYVLTKKTATDFDTAWQAPAATGVPTTRKINTTAPLAGGGDLSADRTLSISVGQAAGTVAAGNDNRFVIPGGAAGQVLTKNSATDWDFTWATLAGLVPIGGAAGQALVKASATDRDLTWAGGPQPVVNYDGTTAKLASDAVSTYPLGISQLFMSNTNASAGGWPITTYCQVVTERTQDPAGFATSQWCMSDTNSTLLVYYRSGNQNGWTAWVLVGQDTGWKTLPLASGYKASSANVTPVYRIKNGIVYYRGQVAPTSGSFAAAAVIIVSALPAEAQPDFTVCNYVMCDVATSSNSYSARAYIYGSNPTNIYIGIGTAGAVYVDLSSLSYPVD